MTGTPRIGQLVYSRAGRDSGRPMVVLRVLDDRFVEVTDGSLRPRQRPKRKNVRHLEAGTAVHPGLAVGEVPDDAGLRGWLARAGAAEARQGG
jgi:hypothetical protein